MLATKDLIDKLKLGEYEGYISEQVMAEIARAPETKKQQLLKLVDGIELELLIMDKEAEMLADKYIAEGLIPAKYRDDAIHIAIASTSNLDVIVSWNFEYMVKLKTKRGVIAVNELMGYKTIEIVTPQEVD